MTKSCGFCFEPADFVPFKDKEALERVRNIKREDIEKHPNPDFKIQVVPNDYLETIWLTDMFYRIKKSADNQENVVLILPNPAPIYKKLAYMINKFEIDCSHVYGFIMDEWADQDGNIAPVTYSNGFVYATLKYLYNEIDPKFRMPRKNIIEPNNENKNDYSKILQDLGGADICYSGPGWTGHLGFIDPDTPEFAGDLEEFKKMGARIVTLHPLTVAQNSLHGNFGMSGDIANVPPKAFTIGPADVIAARNRMEMHGITTAGTFVTWQRMMSRLVLHGPVTPQIPSSILQLLRTDVYVTENLAANIEHQGDLQY